MKISERKKTKELPLRIIIIIIRKCSKHCSPVSTETATRFRFPKATNANKFGECRKR